MKPFCVFLASLACVWLVAAQSSSSSYSRDVSGRRVSSPSFASDGKGGESKVYQNLNGRQVPMQQTAERVLRQDAKSKTIERIVRNYDPNGNLATTTRILVEETKGAGGSSSVRETEFRSEPNGQTREVERRTTQIRTAGQTTNTDVVVERPSVNGGFAAAERRNIVATGPENRRQTVETVLRPAANGVFQQERRDETLVTQQGSQTVTNTVTYEPDLNRRLALSQQTVATATKRPNGETVTETNIYGSAMRGRVYSPGTALQIVEQRIVTQRVAADGSVTETLNTRLPELADPARLGPSQFVAETTCVGKCLPPAPVQEAKAAPAKEARDEDKAKGAPDQTTVAAQAKAPAVEAKATAPAAPGASKAAPAQPGAAKAAPVRRAPNAPLQ